MWVLVGSFLVIVVHVVVPDRRLMALIRVMACASLLGQKSTAGTIRPNRSLAPTRTWAGENIVSWCRGRHHWKTRSPRRMLVSDPGSLLVAARCAAVQEHKDRLPLR